MDNIVGKTFTGRANTTVDGVTVEIESASIDAVTGIVRAALPAHKVLWVGLSVEWPMPKTPEGRLAFQDEFLALWEIV